MTYGGLKSFLYAGVSKDDPRVKAAVDWIRRHYTLEENPGMGKAGLYYYYHTFAKAMDAWARTRSRTPRARSTTGGSELVAKSRPQQRTDRRARGAGRRSGGRPNLRLRGLLA